MDASSDKILADKVYWIDPLKGNTLIVGNIFTGENGVEYKIIQSKNISSDGFQAMAVIPKVNNKFNKHDIQLAYAGTNPGDWHDLLTDGSDINIANGARQGTGQHATHGQFKNAADFYDVVANKYGAQNIKHITGHSLGGAEALYVAALYHKPVTTFSPANPTLYLTEKDVKWLKKHPELVTNYYHGSDKIANWLTKYGLGHSVSVSEFTSNQAKGWLAGLGFNGHMLDSYHVDKNGSIVMSPEASIELAKLQLKAFENRLNKGGLNHAEKIALDAFEALNMAIMLSQVAEDGIDKIIKNYTDTIVKLEPLWHQTLAAANNVGQHLSHNEIISALEGGGVTHKTVVDDPVTELTAKITAAKVVKEDYIKLANNIKKVIDSKLATDVELARLFANG